MGDGERWRHRLEIDGRVDVRDDARILANQPPHLPGMIAQDRPGAYISLQSSVMHVAWTRAVCGRLKSDYQYSVTEKAQASPINLWVRQFDLLALKLETSTLSKLFRRIGAA